jgi:hypothetical protein
MSEIMQPPTARRIGQPDPDTAIKELLNFPRPGDKDYASAGRDFEDRYGDLRKAGAATISGALRRMAGCKWDDKRQRWMCGNPNPGEVNVFVGSVLNEQVGDQHTALHLNLSGKRIQITEHRDLLDAIALKFLDSYRKVRICKRPGCDKLFTYTSNNDRYCSVGCSDIVRSSRQVQYQRDYRKREEAKIQTKTKKARKK